MRLPDCSSSLKQPLPWIILAFSLASLIRLAAAMGDLAIDEIWSLLIVREVIQRLVDILLVRHDNNHLLNTLWMYVIGPDAAGIVYRLPPTLASIGAVWLAGRIAVRSGGLPAARSATIVVGSSYLLILYGTEARGYAYAVFFGYWSWLTLLRIKEAGRWIDAAAFALSSCLGFLAHLTFIYCFAGFCVWSIWQWCRKPNWILPLAQICPSLMAAFLYLVFVRGMAIGGGPIDSLSGTLISTLSIIFGGPQFDDGALIVAILTTVMTAWGFIRLWRTDRALLACYLTTIVLAPAAVLMLTGHGVIYPRYFIIPVAFALLMMSDTLSAWHPASWSGRGVRLAIIAGYLAGNAWWIAGLLNHGRGDYSAALAWMSSQSDAVQATVTSDHDFRNGVIVDYYARRLWPGSTPIRYVARAQAPATGADWFILHNFDGDPANPLIVVEKGYPYQLERTYRHHSLTGWNWWIYRRIEPPNRTRSDAGINR